MTSALASEIYTGRIYALDPGTTVGRVLTLPDGVGATLRRPSWFWHRGSLYIMGLFGRILRVEPDTQVYPAGLVPPPKPPTITASGAGPTCEFIGYFTFEQQDAAGRILQESSFSDSVSISLTADGRQWGNCDQTSPDAHATHIVGWGSIDGALPRRMWQRKIGETATVTEAIPNDTVIVMPDPPVDPVSEELDLEAYNVLPYASVGVLWHDVGVYIKPDFAGIVVSALNKPWGVNGDKDGSEYRTKNGEMPVGLVPDEEFLLVLCKRTAYAFQGWSAGDYSMEKAPGGIGTCGHATIASWRGMSVWWSDEGPIGWIGGEFKNLSEESSRETFAAMYDANPDAYDRADAWITPAGIYKLRVDLDAEPYTLVHELDLRPFLRGKTSEPPAWRAYRTRKDTCVGLVYVESEDVVRGAFGDSTGEVRYEDATDADDDADAAAADDSYGGGKRWRVRFPHHFPTGQAGDRGDTGNAFQAVTVLADHPNNAMTVRCFGGDDNAGEGTGVEKTLKAPTGRLLRRTAEQVTTPQVSGPGITYELEVSNPLGLRIRGLAPHRTIGDGDRRKA